MASAGAGSLIEDAFAAKLPNAKKGEVVMRFAPEPSGYLHIGHAKALLLNDFFVKYFGGKLLLRFDDTNPTKEEAEFEDSIKEDIRALGIEFEGPTYTSDSIPRFAEKIRDLIRRGLAYADDTAQDVMRQERMDGVESARRNAPVEESLRAFDEMEKGSEVGVKFCIRGKINMKDSNRAMRDPVFYRCCLDPPHHRHGHRFKAYPTYDFACPLIDSWAGVTHAMRANEYADRIPQYRWVQKAFDLPTSEIYEFSRLNFTNTVLSKRKLKWLVETGCVEGWDDPRFPTIRGILRRGLTKEALMEFLVEQGPSKNTNLMEWDKLWAKNSKALDSVAPRFMAVTRDTAVRLVLTDLEAPVVKSRPLHPKNEAMGSVDCVLTKHVLLDSDDVQQIVQGESVTLMRAGNVVVDKIRRGEAGDVVEIEAHTDLESTDFKKTRKLHWVAEGEGTVSFLLREFDHIITKRQPEEDDAMEDIVNKNSLFDTTCVGEPALAPFLEKGKFLQLERRGFVRVDRVSSRDSNSLPILNLIPSGKTKSMSTVSTKVDAKSLVKGGDKAVDEGEGNAGEGKLSKKALKRLAFKAAQSNAAPASDTAAAAPAAGCAPDAAGAS